MQAQAGLCKSPQQPLLLLSPHLQCQRSPVRLVQGDPDQQPRDPCLPWRGKLGPGPLGLALGSPIFPSGCEGTLGVALESLQGLRDLT